MSEDLGARLVRAGLATRDQLAAALAAGPVGGGLLVARLIAHGVSEDDVVGMLLSEGHGPVLEMHELLQASSPVVDRIPVEMRRAFLAMPVRPEAQGLLVGMADPTDRHALREIQHLIHGKIVARVTRVSDIASVLGARDDRIPQATPLHLTRRKTTPGDIELSDEDIELADEDIELADEDIGLQEDIEVQEALPEANDGETALPLVKTKPLSRSPQSAPSASQVPGAQAAVVAGATVRKTFKKPAASVPPSEAAEAPQTAPAVVPEPSESGEAYSRPRTRAPSRPPATAPRSIIPPEEATWGDLAAAPVRTKGGPKKVRQESNERRLPDIGATLANIRAAATRDQVVALTCEGVLTVSRAAVFLALRKGVLRGWTGVGTGIAADAIRNLWLPASSPSMFKVVLESGAPHEGAYGTTAADNLYRAATGSRGGRLSIQPVQVGGRVVALLCADEVAFAEAGYERIGVLAHAAGQAFKRLIVEQKR